MELWALWDVLRRRWWLTLLPVVAAFLTLIPTLPRLFDSDTAYTVGIRFSAAAPADVEDVAESPYEDRAYVPWLASEYLIINLPQWVTSDSFARLVQTELTQQAIDIPAEDIRAALASDAARSILVVYITWDDAAETEAIAQSTIKVLQDYNQRAFPQLLAQPARVVALDDVRVNQAAQGLVSRFMPLMRLAVAFAAGLGLAALVEYLDDTIHNPEDLPIPLLAVVPDE